MTLYEMVFRVDDGYNVYEETLHCFVGDPDKVVSLARARSDPSDLVRLMSVCEIEIREVFSAKNIGDPNENSNSSKGETLIPVNRVSERLKSSV